MKTRYRIYTYHREWWMELVAEDDGRKAWQGPFRSWSEAMDAAERHQVSGRAVPRWGERRRTR